MFGTKEIKRLEALVRAKQFEIDNLKTTLKYMGWKGEPSQDEMIKQLAEHLAKTNYMQGLG